MFMSRCSICRRWFRRHEPDLRGAIALVNILRVDELRYVGVGHAARRPLAATEIEVIEAERL